MLVLSLDTSTPAVTAAVCDVGGADSGGADRSLRFVPGPRLLASSTEVATNRHGELLAPMIDRVLREAGVVPGALEAIGVGLGPGPFTGLRVGIMTAAALGDALGIPVYGACSLDVVAAPVHCDECCYAVLTDARRKQVYWASYDEAGGRLEGPELAAPVELAAHLAGTVTHVVGAGAALYRDQLAGFTVVDGHDHPDAAVLAGLLTGKVLNHAPGDELTPLYLRRPDATPPGRPKQVTPA